MEEKTGREDWGNFPGRTLNEQLPLHLFKAKENMSQARL